MLTFAIPISEGYYRKRGIWGTGAPRRCGSSFFLRGKTSLLVTNNDWISILLNSDYGPAFEGVHSTIVFMMLLSFAIGGFIGYVFMWSHEAVSYSRMMVVSVAALPVIIAVMMVVISRTYLIALGLATVFGVIRFRNVLKDIRQTVFILWSIVEGMSVGTMRFSTAVLGALGIGAAFLYLRLVSFGTRLRYDTVVTLRVGGDMAATGRNLKSLLRCHAKKARRISERRVNDGSVDMAYHVLLRDPNRIDELQSALGKVEGLANISVFMYADDAEI